MKDLKILSQNQMLSKRYPKFFKNEIKTKNICTRAAVGVISLHRNVIIFVLVVFSIQNLTNSSTSVRLQNQSGKHINMNIFYLPDI